VNKWAVRNQVVCAVEPSCRATQGCKEKGVFASRLSSQGVCQGALLRLNCIWRVYECVFASWLCARQLLFQV
jgi:hypothetical protein